MPKNTPIVPKMASPISTPAFADATVKLAKTNEMAPRNRPSSAA
ncbi:Uncharacterised protein [Mycobacterium tuberculosis]|nr:Uncharacterised protein [Mycobacterium tuberculosis]COZ19104.1 Uncharacterised protein [Mycobacterium tuberculosis]